MFTRTAFIDGLDLGPAIDWYNEHQEQFHDWLFAQPCKAHPITYPLRVMQHGRWVLSAKQCSSILGLFPKKLHDRSLVRRISFDRALYFSRNCRPEKLIPTRYPKIAIRPRALIPGQTEFHSFSEPNRWAEIALYDVSANNAISKKTTEIVAGQALIHEFGHTIVAEPLYLNNYQLRLSGGKIVDSQQYMREFAQLLDHHKPISTYAGTYFAEGKAAIEADGTLNLKLIEENFCETLAAWYLNFAYCGPLAEDNLRGLSPMSDRPAIETWLSDFVHATGI